MSHWGQRCGVAPAVHCYCTVVTATASTKPPNPATPVPRDTPSFDIAGEGHLLREIVDEALAQGVDHTPHAHAGCAGRSPSRRIPASSRTPPPSF
ncbi:hypothetical protein EDB92DRAFT_1461465 [Lactarius akahatsu]|uniref:Uncharacterized protein n=1 Tax=Lactarius akahatsu TaxID=416441 RepID=A0AAD4L8T4_9AGAM|nr:hypothetical protein EDB92DRAFT_1461465 [Lactarius akahatsu]